MVVSGTLAWRFAVPGLKGNTGAKPERSRHCKGSAVHKLCHWSDDSGKAHRHDEPEPGELPVMNHR